MHFGETANAEAALLRPPPKLGDSKSCEAPPASVTGLLSSGRMCCSVFVQLGLVAPAS